MRNLVLGSSGFVGAYLCQYLREKGETVIEYDIVRDPAEDCRTAELPLDNIDRVYFLAWKVGGSKYLNDPKTQREQLEWNQQILSNCLPQLKNKPFMFVSSQLAENGQTIYGCLKKLGEHWSILNGGVVVKLWNVYGAYENSSVRSHVVADFIHQALSTAEIRMQTTGDEQRQFIYIEDVCNAFYESFNHKGAYDACPANYWTSISELADMISCHISCRVVKGNLIGSTLDELNVNQVPNWEPATHIYAGIRQTIDLFKNKLK